MTDTSSPSLGKPGCHDCGRPYGDEHGFPDLVVPHDIWNAHLSPSRSEGGLLCPSCMCKRAFDAGLKDVPAQFRSGPFAVYDDGPVELGTPAPGSVPSPSPDWRALTELLIRWGEEDDAKPALFEGDVEWATALAKWLTAKGVGGSSPGPSPVGARSSGIGPR